MFLSCKGDEDSIQLLQRNDNGLVLNIPLSGSLQNPAFSPDGNTIIFTRFLNGYNIDPSQIYKFNLNTNQLTLLVGNTSNEIGNVNLPGSSWNNGKIIFSSTKEPHDEIYIIDENGDNETQITQRTNNVAYEPTLSPDNQWIVFESHVLDEETNGIITKFKVDQTSSYIELTSQEEDCRQPNWSPSGNKILYQKKTNEQWNIWIMNIDGTNKNQVTFNLGNCTDASFTSNGQYIVFSSDFQVDLANIYKISIDGTNPIKLTNYEGYDGATSISTDGTKLIFESTDKDPDTSSGTKIVLLGL